MADEKESWWKRLLKSSSETLAPLTSISIALILFATIFSTKLGDWLTDVLLSGARATGAVAEAAIEQLHVLRKKSRVIMLPLAASTIGGLVCLAFGWYRIGAIFVIVTACPGIVLLFAGKAVLEATLELVTWRGLGEKVRVVLFSIISLLAIAPVALFLALLFLWIAATTLPAGLVYSSLALLAVIGIDQFLRSLLSTKAGDRGTGRNPAYKWTFRIVYLILGFICLNQVFIAGKNDQIGVLAKTACVYIDDKLEAINRVGERQRAVTQNLNTQWSGTVANTIHWVVTVKPDSIKADVYTVALWRGVHDPTANQGDTAAAFSPGERVRVIISPEHAKKTKVNSLASKEVWRKASRAFGEGEPIVAITYYDIENRLTRTEQQGWPSVYVFVPSASVQIGAEGAEYGSDSGPDELHQKASTLSFGSFKVEAQITNLRTTAPSNGSVTTTLVAGTEFGRVKGLNATGGQVVTVKPLGGDLALHMQDGVPNPAYGPFGGCSYAGLVPPAGFPRCPYFHDGYSAIWKKWACTFVCPSALYGATIVRIGDGPWHAAIDSRTGEPVPIIAESDGQIQLALNMIYSGNIPGVDPEIIYHAECKGISGSASYSVQVSAAPQAATLVANP